MIDWLYFEHPATGGTFEAADEDGVRERYEALGWKLTDKPEDKPVVPSRLNQPGMEQEWVTMWHPKAKAHHDFPNNTEAIAGALESGWELPKPPKPPVPDQEPDSKPKAKAPAQPTTEEKVTK